MSLYEIAHRYLKNYHRFLDTLKTKDCKIGGNGYLLINCQIS